MAALRAQPGQVSVSAELVIPSAETHVIGDATPLLWRFQNNSDAPLAFMWEGCCRLNGRLTVLSASGQPIDLTPPGQALAHMFAKAERLDPGVLSTYDTRLSDWVRLSESGTYSLQGRYTGVLPSQQPQVPKGLALWRAAATTPPLDVSVICVDDYLAQRDELSARGGVELRLSGDNRVLPPQPVALQCRLLNRADEPRRIRWPDDCQVWLVDRHGQRVANVPVYPDDAYRELTLAPGEDWEQPVMLEPVQFFEGVPFGEYRVFLDLIGPRADEVRVPSNPISLTWQLDDEAVVDLVTQAASGSRLGFRNVPLKLLRVYLSELSAQLERAMAVADAPPAQALATDLWRASRLKPVAPRPGSVTWPIEVSAVGDWHFGEARLDSVAQAFPKENRMPELLKLRRHLGWSVGLSLQPEDDVTLGMLFQLAGEFQAALGPGSGWIRVGTVGALTNRMGGFTVRSEAVPALALLRVQSSQTGLELRAHTAPDSVPVSQQVLERVASRSIEDAAGLQAWLDALPAGCLVQIEAEPAIVWGQVSDGLGPLLRRSDPTVLSPRR